MPVRPTVFFEILSRFRSWEGASHLRIWHPWQLRGAFNLDAGRCPGSTSSRRSGDQPGRLDRALRSASRPWLAGGGRPIEHLGSHCVLPVLAGRSRFGDWPSRPGRPV
jgi:hypothetical protein